jgi:hypothetical protein
MTIRELIDKLKTLDPESHVCVESDLDGINLITKIEVVPVSQNDGESFGYWSEYYRTEGSNFKVTVLN